MPTSLRDLPKDLITEISQYLSVKELCQLKSTGKFFHPAVNEVLIKKLQAQQIKQVAIVTEHTVFLQQDGHVWACGRNNNGQLGIGNRDNQINLHKIPIDDVNYLVTGDSYTLFLKTDGSVWACGGGTNLSGKMGIDYTNQQGNLVKVPLLRKVEKCTFEL